MRPDTVGNAASPRAAVGCPVPGPAHHRPGWPSHHNAAARPRISRSGRRDAPRRLGRRSFETHLSDRVMVEARLSRPAYAYLIAFRPDGEHEVCFPDSAEQPPPRDDRPRYPTNERPKPLP